MELFVAQLLNGLVYGVLLFLMAAGLSLIFGLMNVVSLAHGSFFMLGAFLGLSIFKITGSFWLALFLAPIPVIVLGILMELLFLRRLYRRGHMDQVLLTFGFTFVFLDIVQTLWDRTVLRLPVPVALQGTVQLGLGVFSAYRLFLIGFGFAIALLLWLLLERSRIGAMVRAGVDNAPWRRASGPTSRRYSRRFSDSVSRSRLSAASRLRRYWACIREWMRKSSFRPSLSS
jgi:branched-subunit amino acid ABC-type transport system permease component